MEKIEGLPQHYVYSNQVIDFITIVAQTCRFLEHAYEFSPKEVVENLLKLLPALYTKTVCLDTPEEELEGYLEQFVFENDYNAVAACISDALGEHDAYLELLHENRNLTDEPTVAYISEQVADIYQEIKDLAGNYQTADIFVMAQALTAARQAFTEHWGTKLLNALRELHHIACTVTWEEDEDEHAHTHHDDDCNCHEEKIDGLFDFYRNE